MWRKWGNNCNAIERFYTGQSSLSEIFYILRNAAINVNLNTNTKVQQLWGPRGWQVRIQALNVIPDWEKHWNFRDFKESGDFLFTLAWWIDIGLNAETDHAILITKYFTRKNSNPSEDVIP